MSHIKCLIKMLLHSGKELMFLHFLKRVALLKNADFCKFRLDKVYVYMVESRNLKIE